MQRTKRLSSGLLAGLLSIVFLFAGAAEAHVTVQPPEAEQGGFAKLTFRVPNELPDSATIELRVQLPTDYPFSSVSVKPKQGWTAEVTERTLDTPIDNHGEQISEVVSEISWSGGRIEPGQFDEFEISVGPIPEDVDELFFPSIQVYDNGDEVAWIELPAADGEEPESPAPALTLVASSGDEHGGGTTAEEASTEDGEGTESAASEDHDDSSNSLAVAALVVGGIAIVLSIIAIASGRKRTGA